ncbi:MAG: hypothetical protein ACI935_003357, partial [Moritella dasanensis]
VSEYAARRTTTNNNVIEFSIYNRHAQLSFYYILTANSLNGF